MITSKLKHLTYTYLVLRRKILKLLILNDNSSILQDEDCFDAVSDGQNQQKMGFL